LSMLGSEEWMFACVALAGCGSTSSGSPLEKVREGTGGGVQVK